MRNRVVAYVAVAATGRTAAFGLWAVRSKNGKRLTLCRGERCPRDIRNSHEAMPYAMGRGLDLMRERWPDAREVEFVSHNSQALRRVKGVRGDMDVCSRRSRSYRGYLRWCAEKARGIINGWRTEETPAPDIAAVLED